MTITIHCTISGRDVDTYNEMILWCVGRGVKLEEIITGDTKRTYIMTGDDMMLTPVMVHLKEKQYDF